MAICLCMTHSDCNAVVISAAVKAFEAHATSDHAPRQAFRQFDTAILALYPKNLS
jgi:hypothetical protein